MSRPSLITIIDNHMYDLQSQSDRDNTKFHPSGIGYCSRKIAYGMLQYPSPLIDPRTFRIFENGHSMHERFESWFAEAGIQIAPELELKPDSPDPEIAQRCAELDISGRTDSLVLLDGELYLVELKSANENMFKYHLREPKEHHVQQLQMYMYLTGVYKGFLLYENKNTQELKEFFIDYDPYMVAQLLDKVRRINAHVRAGTLPDKEGMPSTWQCKYCDYRGLCHYPERAQNKAILEAYYKSREGLVEQYNYIANPQG